VPHLTPNRDSLPTALKRNTRWTTVGDADIPVMTVHPRREAMEASDVADDLEGESGAEVPLVIWFHGRTANKELDSGRYLRWMRAGFGACAVDLPGHGERFIEQLQQPEATLEVVEQMVDEVDSVVAAIREAAGDQASPLGGFNPARIAIGGMSAGGMVALARLCRPHQFVAASVEATTGSWSWQGHRAMHHPIISERLNPITHLNRWAEVPLLAIHSKGDEWVAYDGQVEFLDALRMRYDDPQLIELLAFEETGAPSEHLGFGRCAAEAKDRQVEFFRRTLLGVQE